MYCKNTNPPKISIVTPCYNSSQFIHRLHDSLHRQDYKNFEWVLVDDLSTDDTLQVLMSLSPPGEGGISLYKLPQNSGGGVALGFGVEKCMGEIVIMIDHDDELVESAFSTIMDEWSQVENRPEIAGIFYRRLDPRSSKVIGEDLRPGTEFSMSWQANTKPSITDGFMVLKTLITKKYFNPKTLEAICLSGAPLNLMTKKYKLLAGSAVPLLIYHRDNSASQTNFIKISRKTVYTYAKYIEAFDFYYFRRPLHWIRHMIALIKFSIFIHGSPIYHNKFIDSYIIKCFSFVLMPFGFLSYLHSRGKIKIIDLPVFELDRLKTLSEINR